MLKKMVTTFCCLLTIIQTADVWAHTALQERRPFVPMVSNQTFRDEVISYLRSVAIHQANQSPDSAQQQLDTLDATWNNFYQRTDWSIRISLYHLGQKVGEGYSHGSSLSKALQKATELSLSQQPMDRLSPDELNQYRFKVVFDYYPARLYSLIEFNEQGLELIGSRVAVRKLDKKMLEKQIVNSQHYLLQTMHPRVHGFFKFYNAAQDKPENLLRTIYSSSSLYTLLKIYHLNKDPQLLQYFKPIADFILSNQVQDGPNRGGFYYGFNPETGKKTCRIVVGTASKTIFTLLELHRFYPDDKKYLEAAKKAGDWLLTRVNQDGTISAIASCTSGTWKNSRKQSLLYSGQVLSALSRLYGVTHDARYHDGAAKIASNFLKEVKHQGLILGDDYRPANSISSSWVMMSLIDFAKVDPNPVYRTTIEQIASAILSRQIRAQDDVYSNGRYLDAMTTSGNGWINEVMGVLYDFCSSNQLSNCNQYHQAMLLTSRWLIQNAYSAENTYNVKNPKRAIGGFITNFTTQTVRTDAVCHGLNSLIMVLENIGHDNQVLVNLPERPLVELLPLLRAGNGYLS